MITSLFPIPGSKRAAKYKMLRPLPRQNQVCEPFMGGAAKSLETGLKTSLGEINISQRAIAVAPSKTRDSKDYASGYLETLAELTQGIDLDELLPYAKREKAMAAVRAELPHVAETMDERWHTLANRLFQGVSSGQPMPGLYSLCQRSCFGNVMRLNPRGTAYNVTWHVGKLINAVRFDPRLWCEELRSQNWKPRVFESWQDAMQAVRSPNDCYLLLDPPYLEEDGNRKMSPAYPGHRVTCDDGRAMTYGLAVEPLRMGLSRRFPLIHMTNYYSAKLDAEVTQIAHSYGYTADRATIGICGALGNSAGRLKHGLRVDSRPKPIECVWTFRPFEQLNLLDPS